MLCEFCVNYKPGEGCILENGGELMAALSLKIINECPYFLNIGTAGILSNDL